MSVDEKDCFIAILKKFHATIKAEIALLSLEDFSEAAVNLLPGHFV